jgi:hypothetical protein
LGGVVGTPYSIQLSTSAGISPYVWSLAPGSSLPCGLTMTSGGLIGGTLTNACLGNTTVTFNVHDSGSPNDMTASQQLTLTVLATPTLTFAVIPAQTYGGAAFQMSATSASSGTVTYSLTAGQTSAGTVTSGGLVTITGAGTIYLTATQAAAGNFTAATATTQVTVNPETPTLSFASIPAQTFGGAAFQVSATSASSGAVTYSLTAGHTSAGTATSGGLVTITGAGTIYLTATQAAAGNYGAATAITQVTVNTEIPTLSFATIAAQTYGVSPFQVTASSASSGAVTYSLTPGQTSSGSVTSGGLVTVSGVGTIYLTANQAASGNYAAATATTSFAVNAEAPTLTFATIPTETYGNGPFQVTASSASSGAVTYALTPGQTSSGTVASAGSVTITGVGTIYITATQAAAGNYAAATATTQITIYAEAPTLAFATIPAQTYGGGTFTVTASDTGTAVSSGAITYSLTAGQTSSGTVTSAGIVTITGGGTIYLTATQAAAGNYGPATATTQVTVNPAAPTLTFATIPTENYGNQPFQVSATSASNGAVTYSLTPGQTSAGTVTSAGVVTINGIGTIYLTANQAATTNYTATSATTQFTVNAEAPTLAFASIPTQTYGNGAFTVTASDTGTVVSSGAITYSLTPGHTSAGTVTGGGVVTITGAGTIYLTATQAAAGNYATATATTQITVNGEAPTLAFASIPTQTYGNGTFTVTASDTGTVVSSGAITYSLTTGQTSAGTVTSAGVVTITGAGTIYLTATQAAAGNYAAATATTQVTVNAETPTLAFASIPAQTYGNGTFVVTASDTGTVVSTGAITYSLTPGQTSSGTVTSAGVVTITGAGTIYLTATQAAAGNYATATATAQVTVSAEAPTLVFASIPTQTYGNGTFTVTASDSGTVVSSGAITYSLTTGQTSAGTVTSTGVVTITGAGTIYLTATQAATANYSAASATTQVIVNAATPTLAFASIPIQTYGNGTFNVTASDTGTVVSSGAITYSLTPGQTSAGTVTSAGVVTISGAGTIYLTATQAATANYASATATTQVTVNLATPTLAFTAISPHTYGDSAFQVTASDTGTVVSSGAITYSLTPGQTSAGTVTSAGVVTISGAGTIYLTANQAATANYAAATATTQVSINPALAITTATTLPNGLAGSSYNQPLNATGGTGSYTWSLISGSANLTSLGLTFNPGTSGVGATASVTSASAILGGPLNFTVQVSDNANPAHTAQVTFTVTISSYSITTTTLTPAIAYTGSSYTSTAINVSGGTAPYTWSVSAGSLPTGLSLGSGSTTTNTISGTVSSGAATGLYIFTVKVVDHTGLSTTQQYTLNVYNPLSLTAPSSTVPGPAIEGQSYTGNTIFASGGSGNYSWSLNSLPPGLVYTNPTGNSLVISGTAPLATETIDFFVTLTDTTTNKTYGPITYAIAVGPATPLALTPNPNPLPTGTVGQNYNGTITASGGSGTYTSFQVMVGSNLMTVPSAGNGQLLVANGISVSMQGTNMLVISGTPANSIPVALDVTVNDNASNTLSQNYTITVSPVVPTGYTVSGTVNYSGSQAGWVYLELIPNSGCSNCNQNLGTAIDGTLGGPFAPAKSYTIHGVPIGTYTLKAYMDGIGFGIENASNPTGSLSNLNVTSSGLSNQNFTLQDPSAVSLGTLTPTWDPSNGSGVFSGGAVVSFDPICNGSGCNKGGIEMPTSYFLQYSTDSTFNSGVTRKCFLAQGGNSPWIVSGLITGQTYFFRAAGYATACTNTPGTLTYSAAEPTNGLLIGAPTAGSLLSGTVTFAPPAGVTLAGGPLYVGCYASGTLYAERIASPVSPQAYSVKVPDGTSCMVFGFLDQYSSGLIGGPGELSNTNNGIGMVSVTVNGATPANITLPNSNSMPVVKTQTNTGGGNTNYGVGFQVYGEYKLPVAVELLSETPNVNGTVVDVVLPADIATDAFNNYNNEFDYWPQVTGTPVVGDSYTFKVTYSDGTSENLSAAVTGVLNAFATSLSPTGNGVSVTPNFSWTYPSSASSYVYQFQLHDSSNNTIWEIPPQHGGAQGFASTISPFITWGVDPTNTGDLPDSHYLSSGGLQAGTNYNWSIAAYDANMNEAKTQVSFETVTADLSLQASGPGPALAGYAFTGQISASGGSGSGVFTVNGTPIPATGIGNAVSFTGNDGLSAYSTGSNTLYIVGTPTTAENVSLNVSVKDSFSDTASQTYTLVVSAPPTGGAGNANNAKLNGTYVCKSDGFVDATGSRWATVYTLLANGQGSFTTGGTYDTNTRDLPAAISGGYTGTYNIGADNNGITNMTATINGSATTATGSWAIALTSSATPATEFRTVRIDDVGATPSGIHGSSVCYLANTSAFAASTLSGKSLAFGMQGENSSGTPKANVGRMTLSTESSNGGTGGAAGGTITSGYLDGMRLDQTADNGAAFTGSYIAPDTTTGHFTFTLTPTGSSTTITFAVYIIDANRMFMLETAGDTGMLAGDMRTQLQSANTAAALLSGSSVLYSQGYHGNSSGSVTGYESMILQASGAPTATYTDTLTVNTSFDDDAGSYTTGQESGPLAITLDSANPGRATFSPGGGSESSFLYFFNAGSAFFLDMNGTQHYLATGWVEAQTQPSSPPFANANIAGSYLGGSLLRLNSGSNDSISEGTLDSSGVMTGSNTTANAGSLQWDQPFSAMGTLGYSWLSTTYGAFSNSMNGTAFQSCIVITPVKSGATGKAVCIENTSGGANVSISEQ